MTVSQDLVLQCIVGCSENIIELLNNGACDERLLTRDCCYDGGDCPFEW